MIDIFYLAVGMSRQLCGLSMHSERPRHRMYEQWHPVGTIGVVTAFNFPVAVWAWNAMLALVCGDCLIWKPSSSTPLCGIAVHKIMENVLVDNGNGADSDPDGNLDPNSVSLVVGSGPTNGILNLNPDGSFDYTPAANFNGSDTFDYQVCDTLGACATARVTITVNAVNDAPVALKRRKDGRDRPGQRLSDFLRTFHDLFFLSNSGITQIIVRGSGYCLAN